MYPAAPNDGPVHAALAALNTNCLSNSELKELLEDDTRLNSRLKDLSEFCLLENQRDTLLASNRSMAEYITSHEARIQQLRSTVRAGLLNCQQLQQQLGSGGGPEKNVVSLQQLQTAVDESEKQSEELVARLLKGTVGVEEFVSDFLPLRTRGVQRRVRCDKFRELSRRAPHRAPPPVPPSASPALPPGPYVSPYGGRAAPCYPVPGLSPQPYPSTPYPAMPYPAMPLAMPMPRYQ